MTPNVLLKLKARPVLVAMSVLGLVACEPAAQPVLPSPQKAVATAPAARPLGEAPDFKPDAVSYRCMNGEQLRVAYRAPDAALVTYRGETQVLALGQSASGARYAGGGWQWWIKGESEGVFSRLPVDAAIAPGEGVTCKLEVVARPATEIGSPGI